jgi:hypothetical protein
LAARQQGVAFNQEAVDDPIVTELLQVSIALYREKARQLVELDAQQAWMDQHHQERLASYSVGAGQARADLLPAPIAVVQSSTVSAHYLMYYSIACVIFPLLSSISSCTPLMLRAQFLQPYTLCCEYCGCSLHCSRCLAHSPGLHGARRLTA